MFNLKEAYQKALLKKKLCISCTARLSGSVKRETINKDSEVVTCRCGSRYMYERTTEVYKALSDEEYYQIMDMIARNEVAPTT